MNFKKLQEYKEAVLKHGDLAIDRCYYNRYVFLRKQGILCSEDCKRKSLFL